MLIPYTWLSLRPQKIVLFGGVPVYFSLLIPGGHDCLVTLTGAHTFHWGCSVSVPVGTSFELEYKGMVNEIRLGRWIMMCDA
jgi:hypothetical protein